MHPWLAPLHSAFKRNANAELAPAMQAYMKDHFPFFGSISHRAARTDEGPYGDARCTAAGGTARHCWSAFAVPQREMHQVAVDLLMKHAKKLTSEHLPLLEEFH